MRGGKRVGAGRPKVDNTASVQVCVTLPKELAERLRSEKNKGRLVAELVREYYGK